ncbi:DMT family transporter [Rhodoferax sp. GW822-FHT02A01]|uniref:DMT family transporter n=1 Tax=Rhodoferax sp. GW822-FHT02A01 TaxID=3141537 RepID=UPI00315C93DF
MPFSVYDLMALGAAVCWAFTSVMSAGSARHLGALAFTRWRMGLLLFLLWPVVLVSGTWHSLSWAQCGVMALSGFIGIFVGDTALFAAMNRLGPRRTSVLFATHAFFSAVLGYVFLDEHMGLQAMLGGVLVMGGVMTATLLGTHKNEVHEWEANRGGWGLGVALALLAALCQASSSLIAKPVMVSGVDPIAATAVRVSVTCVAQLVLLWSGYPAARAQNPATPRVLLLVGFIGFLGMGVGMSLILWALKHGDVGMVAILSSVSPVVVLPLLWWRLRRAPAPGAWLGAALTVVGTALVLSR